MQADSSLRILLALILGCLVVLVFQGFGGERADRYRVSVIKSSSPWLMRVDTATGRVEQFRLRGAPTWVALEGPPEAPREAAAETTAPAEPAVAKARPDEPPRKLKPPSMLPRSEPVPASAKPPPLPAKPAANARQPIRVDAETEVDALAQALSPANPPEIRAWAASQLASFAVAQAVPVLVETLGDPDATVVVAAIEALGRTGDERGRSAIRDLLDHPDAAVQAAARQAIEGP